MIFKIDYQLTIQKAPANLNITWTVLFDLFFHIYVTYGQNSDYRALLPATYFCKKKKKIKWAGQVHFRFTPSPTDTKYFHKILLPL